MQIVRVLFILRKKTPVDDCTYFKSYHRVCMIQGKSLDPNFSWVVLRGLISCVLENSMEQIFRSANH